jgi:type I restriction enzyme S subunit
MSSSIPDMTPPDGWKYFNFTDLLDIQGGNQPPKRDFINEPREGYVRLVQIRDFTSADYAVYIPESKKWRTFDENDILIGRYGASVGRICRGLKGVYNVALAKVIYPRDLIDGDYLYYLLKSEDFQQPLTNISRTAQAGFNKEDLSSIRLPLPHLEEQKRIANRIKSLLGKVELTRSILNETMTLLETAHENILNRAFQGKL